MKLLLPNVILVALVIAVTVQPVFAQNLDDVKFSVKAVIPENQVNTRNTFFDLKMSPGDNQNLVVNVFNNSTEDMKVNIAVNAASTNQGGIIDYSSNKVPDESMKISLPSISTINANQVTIPASSTVPVTVSLAMPQESFDGVVLGGIVITKALPENAESPAKGVTIKNNYSYIIGVQLRETDTVVNPDLHLKSVKPMLVNHYTAIVASIQNSEAAVLKGLTISSQVYAGANKNAVLDVTKDNVDIAPNSLYDHSIDWGDIRIQSGDYRMHIKATNGSKAWEWDKNFTVEPTSAANLNSGSVNLIKPIYHMTWFYVAVGLFFLIVVCGIAFRAGRKRKEIDN